MSKNIIDKIWDLHVVESKKDFPDVLNIDIQLLHEVTSPQAFNVLRERNLPIYDINRCIATVDHSIETSQDRAKPRKGRGYMQVQKLRENTKDFDVTLLDIDTGNQGIVHIIGPELGLTQPGLTIVCGDSHTSTHGAFGAIAFGIGTTEVGHVMATGCLLQNRPKTMQIHFKGRPKNEIQSKDLILKLIQKIGIAGGTGYILEYTGDIVKKLTMDERMTICNMSIECGARAGLVSPDEMTFKYLHGRLLAPIGDKWEKAQKFWSSLKSDPGSKFDSVVEIDVSNLNPVVTWGTNPSQSIQIDETIPDPKDYFGAEKESIEKALHYTRLKPNTPIDGLPVDYVFIGSCTNARLSDLEDAAEIFKKGKVHEKVKVFVVPGSESVRDRAIKMGLDKVFVDAGADFRMPGCSMCLAMNEDIVPKGKRCASTSNRNFIGRQGPGSITHLMSPKMAAAAAITGKITDYRKLEVI